jgi:hypothetical protein
MRRQLTPIVAAAVVALAAVGCSGSTTPTQTIAPQSGGPVASSTTATVAPAPSASLPPASATVTFTGAVSGMAPGPSVGCNSPAISGLAIVLFGATATKDLYSTITISAQKVTVTLDAGGGATFSARSFAGTGVTGFDAAKGAVIDSPLTEVPSSSRPGTIPAISAIKGTIDCGNQVPGSSSVTISGSAPEGALSGPIDPVRVDCNPHATPATVHATGIIKLGTMPVILVFQATGTGFTAFVPPTTTSTQHFFMTTDPTTATISASGAHIAGTATEAGTTNSVTVNGDLVCGVVNP